MKNILVLLILLSLLTACKDGGNANGWKSLDLLQYGLPVTIQAPAESTVEKQDMGVWQDITVKSGDDYYVQLLCSNTTTLDVAKVKTGILEEVKNGPFFSKIVEDHPDGFIFEKKVSEERINYDFRYIKIMGDKEYVFQTGLIGTFSEEAVRKMYKAVQQ